MNIVFIIVVLTTFLLVHTPKPSQYDAWYKEEIIKKVLNKMTSGASKTKAIKLVAANSLPSEKSIWNWMSTQTNGGVIISFLLVFSFFFLKNDDVIVNVREKCNMISWLF